MSGNTYLDAHKVSKADDELMIEVLEAGHKYKLSWPSPVGGNSILHLNFQSGPVFESGTNGITGEMLIAILIDRLLYFQNGPHNCRENALALTKLEEALHWLNKRTRDRMARGVEGTNQL